MCFDGALGDIQVASDFSVVTSLEKQVDDLAFPGSYLIEFFFHKFTAPHRCTRPREVALNRCPLGASGFGSLRLILQLLGQNRLGRLTKDENLM